MKNGYLRKSIQDRAPIVDETGKRSWAVIILMSLLFASFLSPQLSYWGRGLRLSIPLFFLLIIIALFKLKKEKKLIRLVNEQMKYIVVGLIFVANGFIRYFLDSQDYILQNYAISPLIIVMLWIAMVFLRGQSPKTIDTVKLVTLLVLGASVGVGIPLLYNIPGVARFTMGNPLERDYIAIYFPQGIANYTLYTAIAISWPTIGHWLVTFNHKYFIAKWVGWASLTVLAATVFLSTFTGAMLLLIIGIFMLLLMLIFKGSKNNSVIAIVVLLLLVYLIPPLYEYGQTTAATEFSTNKATKLITSMINDDSVAGDNGRVQMLINTWPTIAQSPFFGAWGFGSSMYFGGHSSWGDFLALFGFFGLALWLYFLSPSLKRGINPFSIPDGIAGGTISWMLVCIGGILNPTLNITQIILLVWIFDMKNLSENQEVFASYQNAQNLNRLKTFENV